MAPRGSRCGWAAPLLLLRMLLSLAPLVTSTHAQSDGYSVWIGAAASFPFRESPAHAARLHVAAFARAVHAYNALGEAPLPWRNVSALSLDGETHYVDLNSPAPLPTFGGAGAAWSVSLWIRVAGSNRPGAPVLSCATDAGSDSISLFVDAHNRLVLSTDNDANLEAFGSFGASALPLHGHWFHIAMAGAGTELRVFVNGELFKTHTITAINAVVRSACYLGGKSNVQTFVGAPWFEGSVSMLAFFTRQLSPSDVHALCGVHASGILSRALVGYHTFLEPPTSNYWVTSNDGVRVLPWSAFQAAHVHNDAGLDLNDAAVIGAQTKMDAVSVGGFGASVSFSLWFRVTSQSATQQTMLYLSDGGTALIRLFVEQSGVNDRIWLTWMDVIPNQISEALGEARTGQWTHVVVSMDSTHRVRSYINGISQSQPDPSLSGLPVPVGSWSRAFLGGDDVNGLNGVAGSVFGFAVWSEVLSELDVTALAQPLVSTLQWTSVPSVLISGEVNLLQFELSRAVPRFELKVSAAYEGAGGLETTGASATLTNPVLLFDPAVPTGPTYVLSLTPAVGSTSVTLTFSWDMGLVWPDHLPRVSVPDPVRFEVLEPSLTREVGWAAMSAKQVTNSADFFTEFVRDSALTEPGASPLSPPHPGLSWIAETNLRTFDGTYFMDLDDLGVKGDWNRDGQLWTGLDNPSAVSLSAWVQFWDSSKTQHVFVSSTGLDDESVSFGAAWNGAEFQPWLSIKSTAAGVVCSLGLSADDAGGDITLEGFVHVAATFGNGRCTTYLNGRIVAQAVASTDKIGVTDRTFNMIGRNFAGDVLLDGLLAHFGLWNRKLTHQEIRILAATPPSSLTPPKTSDVTMTLVPGAPSFESLIKIAGTTGDFTEAFVSVGPGSTPVRRRLLAFPGADSGESAGPSLIAQTRVHNLADVDEQIDLTHQARFRFQTLSRSWTQLSGLTFSSWIHLASHELNQPIFTAMSAYDLPLLLHYSVYLVNGVPAFTFSTDAANVCRALAMPADVIAIDTWVHISAILARPDVKQQYYTCSIIVNGRRVGYDRSTSAPHLPTMELAPKSCAGFIGAFLPNCATQTGAQCPVAAGPQTIKAQFASAHFFPIALQLRDVQTLLSHPPLSLSAPQPRPSLASLLYGSAIYFLPLTDVHLSLSSPGAPVFVDSATLAKADESLLRPWQPVPTGYTTFEEGKALDLMQPASVGVGLERFAHIVVEREISIHTWLRIDRIEDKQETCLFDAGTSDGADPKPVFLQRLSLDGTAEQGAAVWFKIDHCSSGSLADCTPVCQLRSFTLLQVNLKWRLVTATLDSKGVCSIYIDGKLDAQNRPVRSTHAMQVGGHRGGAPSLGFREVASLGQCALTQTNGFRHAFNGALTHFAVFDRALSAQEIGAMASDVPLAIRTVQQQTAVAQFALLDVPRPTRDWSLQTDPGGGEWTLVLPENGIPSSNLKVARVDFATGAIDLNRPDHNRPSLQVMPLIALPGQAMTFAMWLRWEVEPPSGIDADWFVCKPSSGSLNAILLSSGVLEGTYGLLHVGATGVKAPRNHRIYTAERSFSRHQWHHVSIVLDQPNYSSRIYINGALQAFGGWLPTATLTPVTRDDCKIAASFVGTLDVASVTYHDSALSPRELLQLFRAPPPQLSHLLVEAEPVRLLRSAAAVWFGRHSTPGRINMSSPGDNPDATNFPFYAAHAPMTALSNQLTDGLSFSLWMMIADSARMQQDVINLWEVSSMPQAESVKLWYGIDNAASNVPDVLDLRYFCLRVSTGAVGGLADARLYGAGFVDGGFSPVSGVWFHMVIQISADNVVSQYVDGKRMGAVRISGPEYQLQPLIPAARRMGSFMQGVPGFVWGAFPMAFQDLDGEIDSIALFTRLLSDMEISVLGTKPATASPSPLPAPPTDMFSKAQSVWSFQVLDKKARWTLEPAPSGVGTVAVIDAAKDAYVDLSDPELNQPSRKPVEETVGPELTVLVWVKWHGLGEKPEDINGEGAVVWDFAADDKLSDRLALVLNPKTRSLSVLFPKKEELASPAHSVRPWEWQQYVFVHSPGSKSKMPSRLYINGGLVAYNKFDLSDTARKVKYLGITADTKIRSKFSTAGFALWHKVTLTDAQVLASFYQPPSTLRDALGSPHTQLMRTAVSTLDCSRPPRHAGWLRGPVPDSGLCTFNGDVSSNGGQWLDLSSPLDNPSGPVVPPLFGWGVDFGSKEAQSIHQTYSFHFTSIDAPLVYATTLYKDVDPVSLLECTDRDKGVFLLQLDFVPSQMLFHFRLRDENKDTHCELKFQAPAHTKDAGAAAHTTEGPHHVMLTVSQIDGKDATISLALNGLSQSLKCSQADKYNLWTEFKWPTLGTCKFGTSEGPRRFRGTLGQFAMWNRAITEQEANMLLGHMPDGYSKGPLTLTASTTVIDTNTTSIRWQRVLFRANRPLGVHANELTSVGALTYINTADKGQAKNMEAECTNLVQLDASSFECDMPLWERAVGESTLQAQLAIVSPGQTSGRRQWQLTPVTIVLHTRAASDASDLRAQAVIDWPAVMPLTMNPSLQSVATPANDGSTMLRTIAAIDAVGMPLDPEVDPTGGFTFSAWVQLPRYALPSERVLSFWSGAVAEELLSMMPTTRAEGSAGNYVVRAYSAFSVVCETYVTLKSLGAFQFLAVRYTAANQQRNYAVVDVLSRGHVLSSARCSSPLRPGTRYGKSNVGGANPAGGSGMDLGLLSVAVFDSALSDHALAVLGADLPAGLSSSPMQLVSPPFLSSLYPVANLTVQPMVDYGTPVRFEVRYDGHELMASDNVRLYPASLLFLDAEPQTITIVAAKTANSVQLQFTAIDSPNRVLDPADLCIPVRQAPTPASPGVLADLLDSVHFSMQSLSYWSGKLINDLSPNFPNAVLPPFVVDGDSDGYFVPLNTWTSDAPAGGQRRNKFIDLHSSTDNGGRIYTTDPVATESGVTVALSLALLAADDFGTHVNVNALDTPLFLFRSTVTDDALSLRFFKGDIILEAFVNSTVACEARVPFAVLPLSLPSLIAATLSRVYPASEQTCSLYVQGVKAASGSFGSLRWQTVERDLAWVGQSYPQGLHSNLAAFIAGVVYFPFDLQPAVLAGLLSVSDAVKASVMSSSVRAELTQFDSVVLDMKSPMEFAVHSAGRAVAGIAELERSGLATGDGVVGRVDMSRVDSVPEMALLQPRAAITQEAMSYMYQNDPIYTAESFTMWANIDARATLQDGDRLMDCSVDGALSTNYMLLTGPSHAISFQIYDGSAFVGAVTTPPHAFALDAWFHIAVTTGLSGQNAGARMWPTKLYINGRLAATTSDALYARRLPSPTSERATCALMADADLTRYTQMAVAQFSYTPKIALTPAAILAAAMQPPPSVWVPALLPPPTGAGSFMHEFGACAAANTLISLTGVATDLLSIPVSAGALPVSALFDANDQSIWHPDPAPLPSSSYRVLFDFGAAKSIVRMRLLGVGNPSYDVREVQVFNDAAEKNLIALFRPVTLYGAVRSFGSDLIPRKNLSAPSHTWTVLLTGSNYVIPVSGRLSSFDIFVEGGRDGHPVNLQVWRPVPGTTTNFSFVAEIAAEATLAGAVFSTLPADSNAATQPADPYVQAGDVLAIAVDGGDSPIAYNPSSSAADGVLFLDGVFRTEGVLDTQLSWVLADMRAYSIRVNVEPVLPYLFSFPTGSPALASPSLILRLFGASKDRNQLRVSEIGFVESECTGIPTVRFNMGAVACGAMEMFYRPVKAPASAPLTKCRAGSGIDGVDPTVFKCVLPSAPLDFPLNEPIGFGLLDSDSTLQPIVDASLQTFILLGSAKDIVDLTAAVAWEFPRGSGALGLGGQWHEQTPAAMLGAGFTVFNGAPASPDWSMMDPSRNPRSGILGRQAITLLSFPFTFRFHVYRPLSPLELSSSLLTIRWAVTDPLRAAPSLFVYTIRFLRDSYWQKAVLVDKAGGELLHTLLDDSEARDLPSWEGTVGAWHSLVLVAHDPTSIALQSELEPPTPVAPPLDLSGGGGGAQTKFRRRLLQVTKSVGTPTKAIGPAPAAVTLTQVYVPPEMRFTLDADNQILLSDTSQLKSPLMAVENMQYWRRAIMKSEGAILASVPPASVYPVVFHIDHVPSILHPALGSFAFHIKPVAFVSGGVNLTIAAVGCVVTPAEITWDTNGDFSTVSISDIDTSVISIALSFALSGPSADYYRAPEPLCIAMASATPSSNFTATRLLASSLLNLLPTGPSATESYVSSDNVAYFDSSMSTLGIDLFNPLNTGGMVADTDTFDWSALDGFTVAMWLRLGHMAPGSPLPCLWEMSDPLTVTGSNTKGGALNNTRLRLEYNPDEGLLQFVIESSEVHFQSPLFGATTGDWHQVTVVLEAVSGVASLKAAAVPGRSVAVYAAGTLFSRKPISMNLDAHLTGLGAEMRAFRVGSCPSRPSELELAQLTYWARPLRAEQVAVLALLPPPVLQAAPHAVVPIAFSGGASINTTATPMPTDSLTPIHLLVEHIPLMCVPSVATAFDLSFYPTPTDTEGLLGGTLDTVANSIAGDIPIDGAMVHVPLPISISAYGFPTRVNSGESLVIVPTVLSLFALTATGGTSADVPLPPSPTLASAVRWYLTTPLVFVKANLTVEFYINGPDVVTLSINTSSVVRTATFPTSVAVLPLGPDANLLTVSSLLHGDYQFVVFNPVTVMSLVLIDDMFPLAPSPLTPLFDPAITDPYVAVLHDSAVSCTFKLGLVTDGQADVDFYNVDGALATVHVVGSTLFVRNYPLHRGDNWITVQSIVPGTDLYTIQIIVGQPCSSVPVPWYQTLSLGPDRPMMAKDAELFAPLLVGSPYACEPLPSDVERTFTWDVTLLRESHRAGAELGSVVSLGSLGPATNLARDVRERAYTTLDGSPDTIPLLMPAYSFLEGYVYDVRVTVSFFSVPSGGGGGGPPLARRRLLQMAVDPIFYYSVNTSLQVTVAPLAADLQVVIILGVPSPLDIAPSDTLRLTATALANTFPIGHALSYSWNIIAAANGSLSACPDLTLAANLGAPANEATLVLLPHMLLPGLYTFQVSVLDPLTPGLGASATAEVRVNAPPVSGDCTLAPAAGEAFSTLFTMTCSGWTESTAQHLPLTYSFACYYPAEPNTMIQVTGESASPVATFTLPPGVLQVRATIRDLVLSASTVDREAVVTASAFCTVSPLLCVANTTDVVLPPVLGSGACTPPMVLVQQAADVLNGVATTPALSDPVSQAEVQRLYGVMAADLWLAWDNCLIAVGPNPMPQTVLAVISQSLQALTVQATLFTNQTLWGATALAQNVSTTAIGAAETLSTASFTAMGATASQLMTRCSQLDAVAHLVHTLMHAQQVHAVAGESIALTQDNYLSFVQRDFVSEGSHVMLPNGQSITLTASGLAAYAAQLNAITVGNLSIATTGFAEMDTRVVTFDVRWASCRGQPSLTPPTVIEITFPNGTHVDIPTVGPVVLTLPINGTAAQMALAHARGLLCLEALGGWNETETAEEIFECTFWNVTTQSYSTDGCHGVGVILSANVSQLTCACSHLTEFAVLYAEASRRFGATQNRVCSPVESNFGHWLWLVLMILYSCLGFVALLQTARILWHKSYMKFWLMSFEYTLIVCLCTCRALNHAIYWTLYKTMEFKMQAMISGLPYIFYSWIFTFVIVAWAALLYASAKGARGADVFRPYRVPFALLNASISVVLFSVFLRMSESSDLSELDRLNYTGVLITAIVEFLFAVGFVVYGGMLVRRLTKDFKSPYARKLSTVAVLLACTFGCSGCFLLYSVVNPGVYAANLIPYSAVYFALDLFGIFLVLLLFHSSLRKAIDADKAAGGKRWVVSKRATLGVSRISLREATTVVGAAAAAKYVEPMDDETADNNAAYKIVQDERDSATEVSVSDEGESAALTAAAAAALVAAGAAAGAARDPPAAVVSASSDCEDGVAAARLALHGWLLFDDPDGVCGPEDEVKLVEQLQPDGAPFSPPLFARYRKPHHWNLLPTLEEEAVAAAASALAGSVVPPPLRNPNAWILFDSPDDPAPGDNVKDVQQFDAKGQPFSPPVYKRFVQKGLSDEQASTIANDTAAAVEAARMAHQWIVLEEASQQSGSAAFTRKPTHVQKKGAKSVMHKTAAAMAARAAQAKGAVAMAAAAASASACACAPSVASASSAASTVSASSSSPASCPSPTAKASTPPPRDDDVIRPHVSLERAASLLRHKRCSSLKPSLGSDAGSLPGSPTARSTPKLTLPSSPTARAVAVGSASPRIQPPSASATPRLLSRSPPPPSPPSLLARAGSAAADGSPSSGSFALSSPSAAAAAAAASDPMSPTAVSVHLARQGSDVFALPGPAIGSQSCIPGVTHEDEHERYHR